MNTPDPQTHAFLLEEGDAWFERNRAVNEAKASHFEYELLSAELKPFEADIHHVLEIGCGDGHKTELLARMFGAHAFGIDPSRKAIDHGMARLRAAQVKDVVLQVGTAARLDWPQDSFDLVFFGFCLYLVGRAELMAAVAEAGRVLRPGGFLVVLDFDPPGRHRREYHHRPGLYSYKQDYPALFTASGQFHLFAKRSFSQGTTHFLRDPDGRVAMSFLYKEPQPYPLHQPGEARA